MIKKTLGNNRDWLVQCSICWTYFHNNDFHNHRCLYFHRYSISGVPINSNTILEVFRLRALERDHYRCQKCNVKYPLEIHHINNHIALELDNLVTLCRSCHKQIHKKKRGINPYPNILLV